MKKAIIRIIILILLLNTVTLLDNVYFAADEDFPPISTAPQNVITKLEK